MKELSSWGRYPKIPQVKHSVEWASELAFTMEKLIGKYVSILPYGNGRSYGDSCLANSNNVLNMRTLNRFISVDWKLGLITAEAGVTLEEILSVSIPNGWFLPATPGTKFVTLGGAIANDVHGKNHHVRGTFGCHIKKFGLIRSASPLIECSPQVHTELFNATIGGLGLTGVVAWAQLQLIPIDSSLITTRTIRFESLAEFMSLSNELDKTHEYSVAWVDCTAKGESVGRGVFMVGDHCASGDLKVNVKSKLNVPFAPPISAVNQLTLNLFNAAYFHKHKPNAYSIMDYDPFFYPLDGINNWNRIYGSRGFQQYQCVIPESLAGDALAEILKLISASGQGSFLAVLKRCGDIVSPGLLSFPLPGISLALDFAQSPFINDILFPQLDQIVKLAGGRLYPAKDAHMSAQHFQHFYPNWLELEQIRDPGINSHFWQRVSTA
ncbi:MAG: FAD-binding oxidoreductase [Pseudomonadota bacterium]